jgi:hypothetical protein
MDYWPDTEKAAVPLSDGYEPAHVGGEAALSAPSTHKGKSAALAAELDVHRDHTSVVAMLLLTVVTMRTMVATVRNDINKMTAEDSRKSRRWRLSKA